MEFLDIEVSGFKISEHSRDVLENAMLIEKYISGPYVMGDGNGWYVGGVTFKDGVVKGSRTTSYMSEEEEASEKLKLYIF